MSGNNLANFLPPIKMDAAAEALPLDLVGHTVALYYRSRPGAAIYVSKTPNSADRWPLRAAGDGWKHDPFTRLYLWWSADAGAEFQIYVAGDPASADTKLASPLIGQALAQAVTIDTSGGNVPVTIAAQTLSPIAVAGPVSQAGGVPWDVNPAYLDPSTAQVVPVAGGTNSTSYTTIYTVPASKLLYIRGGGAHTAGGSGWNVGGWIAVTDAADAVGPEWYTHDVNGVNLRIHPIGPFPAGYKVKIKAGAGQVMTAALDAFLMDAP